MADSLPARDSQSAEIPNPIWKRSVWHARNAARTLCFERPKRAESIMDVKIIRTVISCPGRNLPKKNVRNAEALWLRREISFFASMKHAVILKINLKKNNCAKFHARKAKEAAVCSFFALNILKIQKNYDKLKICQE